VVDVALELGGLDGFVARHGENFDTDCTDLHEFPIRAIRVSNWREQNIA
jgi:hypothetical protein